MHWTQRLALVSSIAILAGGCAKAPPPKGRPPSTESLTKLPAAIPDTKPISKETAFTLTAEELARAYEKDKAAADGKYKDKYLEIEGPVHSTSLIFGDPAVFVQSFSDPAELKISMLHCLFAAGTEAKIGGLVKGQKIKFKGKCASIDVSMVQLSDCELLDVGPDPTIRVSAIGLTQAYADNESAADRKYKGKPVLIEGVVVKLEENSSAYTLILEGFDEKAELPPRISAAYPASAKKTFAALKPGQMVKIRGECDGKVGTEVVVSRAELAN